jgi:KDO2-lipid IV(A) lauroyltransferase
VIAAYIHRNGSFNHRITLKHIKLPSPTGDREKDIVRRTQLFTNILEEAIREYPEQWVWMHKRWKTQTVTHNTKGR